MIKRVTAIAGALLVATALVAATRAPIPDRLSDEEFWRLVTTFSETGGAFHAENFTSNEPNFPDIAKLLADGPSGGAYVGVGPEQNFTYIAALRPQIAFVVDIRRQAVIQHLLFKAIFEMSSDRADFISLLFSWPRPKDIGPSSTIDALWRAFPAAPGTDEARYSKNVDAVLDRLTKTHGFALTDDDRTSLTYVYGVFFKFGPAINYASNTTAYRTTGNTNFAKLMAARDSGGTPRSFLATEQSFAVVKDLEARNLVVPIQGDFAGPRAIRAIGDYLRQHDAVVRLFYLSNVEQYLFNPAAPGGKEVNGGWQAFYDNVATLPLDATSAFLRVPFGTGGVMVPDPARGSLVPTLRRETPPTCPILPFLAVVRAGGVRTLANAMTCGK
jgi:hypothetical protein